MGAEPAAVEHMAQVRAARGGPGQARAARRAANLGRAIGNRATEALLREPTGSQDLHALARGASRPVGSSHDGVEAEVRAVAAAVASRPWPAAEPAPASGGPLPPLLRGHLERELGADLGHVRVHLGDTSARLAERLGAKAFTLGSHVVFGVGMWDPATSAGRALVAHEAAHVAAGHAELAVRRENGVTVVLVDTPDPLGHYSFLRGALDVADWEALNDAARLRGRRANAPIGPPAPPGLGGDTTDEDVAATARTSVRLALSRLLVPPVPGGAAGGADYRRAVFDGLAAGTGGRAAAAQAVQDEMVRHWAADHEAIVQGEVEVTVVDVEARLQTETELLFTIDGHSVATADGRLWLADVADAVATGSLAPVTAAVTNEVREVEQAAVLASEVDRLVGMAEREVVSKAKDEVAGQYAESMLQTLGELSGEIRAFRDGRGTVGGFLAAAATRVDGFRSGQLEPWVVEQRRVLAANQPSPYGMGSHLERMVEAIEAQERATTWWERWGAAQATATASEAHAYTDILTLGGATTDYNLRQAYRQGQISLRSYREGVEANDRRSAITGAVNGILLVATLGLGFVVAPETIGGAILFGGTMSASTTLTTSLVHRHYTTSVTLSDPLAQVIWQGSAQTPGQIALGTLGSFAVGAALSGVGAWLGRGANVSMARSLVAESYGNPNLVRQVAPGLTARAVSPGVIEVVQEGLPGVVRFTAQGIDVPAVGGAPAVRQPWAPGTRPFDHALFQQPGGPPIGIAVGQGRWAVMGINGRVLASGTFSEAPTSVAGVGGVPAPASGSNFPVLLPAGPEGRSSGILLPNGMVIPGGRTPLMLPSAMGSPAPPASSLLLPGGSGPALSGPPPPPYAGEFYIDLQGGPAVRTDTGAPSFLPSVVQSRPGSTGLLYEAADWELGYGNVSVTNRRDLDLSRQILQNMPRWPPSTIGQPSDPLAPWLADPRIMYPTTGSVQVYTLPRVPGSAQQPQPFFPAQGGLTPQGVRRLIPVSIGGREAQEDVSALLRTTAPALRGQADRVYWRRPFGLQAADGSTVQAMGDEVGAMLRPGGFFEARLLRSGDRALIRSMANRVGGRVVEVPQRAIDRYARTGTRPSNIDDEQWAILQEAGPDLRNELGALGRGRFNSIIRVYKPGS